jgi:Flp pilus assembly protein TadB
MIAVAAAVAVGGAAALAARRVVPPTARLAPRVRPYTAHVRAGTGRPVDPLARVSGGGGRGETRVDAARAGLARLGRLVDARSDEQLELLLDRAGVRDGGVDAYGARRALGGLAGSALAAVAAALAGVPGWGVGAATLAGFVLGATRERARLERRVAERAERARLELSTVDQVLAIWIRSGAGPVQAVQRVVDRGAGVVVEELDRVLQSIRAGVPEATAFRRAAARSVTPDAARTYSLVASAIERGADLGDALLALSRDLREARREEARRAGIRRRAAMLVPTIAVLAPVMLLFVAAPLPSFVLGTR